MDAQGPQHVFRRGHGVKRGILADIPKFDLPVATPTNQFSQTSSLHVNVGNPLLMFSPYFDHCHGRFQPLVKDTDRTIPIATNENIAGDLVRGE